jgi:dienelactone hydrolase
VIFLFTLLLAQAPQQTPQDVEAHARAIVGMLIAGEYAKIESQYDDQMARALAPGALGASWTNSARQLGAFESITGVQVSQAASNHVATATCAFKNYSVTLRIVFNDAGQLSGLASTSLTPRVAWSPPSYSDPSLFEERAVTVKTGRFELPGFVTVPKSPGKHAAIVLVHGSGPNDMDESAGPNKMFKDLAYGLAGRGIAVLRYDKRTRKYGAQISDDPAQMTVKDEVIDDALSAVALVAAMSEVDPRRVFIAGHSLGAYLAPRIATGQPQIAGIIVLAANARPIEDLVVEQVRYEASMAGPMTPAIQRAIDSAEASAKSIRDPELKPGTTVRLLGSPLPASYFLDLRTYHPTEVAASLKIPMLFLQGERDYQVTMTDFALWQKALAGHANATLKSYSGLNHHFMMGTGPGSPAEYMQPNHVDTRVVDDIVAFCSTPRS